MTTLRNVKAIEFLTMPRNDLANAIDEMPSSARGELARELDSIVQAAAFAFGYVDHRYGNGCGDQGDVDSMKNARRKLKQVRKVLGYTYP
jgi:hypothetical protein